jgi:hypothetical protein
MSELPGRSWQVVKSLVPFRNHVISFKLPGWSQLSQLNLKVLFPRRAGLSYIIQRERMRPCPGAPNFLMKFAGLLKTSEAFPTRRYETAATA